MKLWVLLFIGAVWAAHLPSQGNAKSLRELSASDRGDHLDFGTRRMKKNIDLDQLEGKKSMIISASLVVRRKFINEDIEEYHNHFIRTLMSLNPEDLLRDDLQAVIVKKYRDGSDYTDEDEAYYNAFKEITDNRQLLAKIWAMDDKITSTIDAEDGHKMDPLLDSFVGMTIAELKSPNFLQILKGKVDKLIGNKARNPSQ